MKKMILTVGSLFMAGSLSAQVTPKSFMNDPMFPLVVISLFVFVVVILVLISAVVLLRVLNIMVRNAGMEKAAKLGILYVPDQTWYEKLWMDLNATVPLAEEKDIELDHSYDGIKELD